MTAGIGGAAPPPSEGAAERRAGGGKAWMPVLTVPAHWPPRYNANTEPCDMISGFPCCCGAWHDLGEEWVLNRLRTYGTPERPR